MQGLDFTPLVWMSVLGAAFVVAVIVLLLASLVFSVPLWAIVPATAVAFVALKFSARL